LAATKVTYHSRDQGQGDVRDHGRASGVGCEFFGTRFKVRAVFNTLVVTVLEPNNVDDVLKQ
jgi:hypothetical protein